MIGRQLVEDRGDSIACIRKQLLALNAFAMRHMITKGKRNKKQQALAK